MLSLRVVGRDTIDENAYYTSVQTKVKAITTQLMSNDKRHRLDVEVEFTYVNQ